MSTIHEIVAPGLAREWKDVEIIAETKTEFQKVVIAKTCQGITLFCGGEMQSSEAVQKEYHEGMAIPALCLQPNMKFALVIGCSEGAVPVIINRLAPSCVVDHVDIDEKCVEYCREYLPYGYPKVTPELMKEHKDTHPHYLPANIRPHYMDGIKFLEECTDKRWNTIFCDAPEIVPDGQQNRLYHRDFYKLVSEHLPPDGVFVTLGGNPETWRSEQLVYIFNEMTEAFPMVLYWGVPCRNWAFLIGLKSRMANVVGPMQNGLAHLNRITHVQTIAPTDVAASLTIPKPILDKLKGLA